MRTITDMVSQEIMANITPLVTTLQNAGLYKENSSFCESFPELLYAKNWEEAANDHITDMPESEVLGWIADYDYYPAITADAKGIMKSIVEGDGWQEFCSDENLEPYYDKVYEYYIVSDWLARKLEEHGCTTICNNMHGLIVWGRTTTGQLIEADYIIKEIYAEVVA